jgi:hypothetical protein
LKWDFETIGNLHLRFFDVQTNMFQKRRDTVGELGRVKISPRSSLL